VGSTTKTTKDWVRIGANTNWSMILLTLGVTVGSALLLATPVAGLIVVVTGENPSWLVTALWVALMGILLLWLPLIVFPNRPARINLNRKLIRVGWRTIRFDQLHHVYRLPGGMAADATILRLDIAKGIDARLPLTSDALPNLTLNELTVLLAVLEQAPIEPKPGLPLHAPIADELGPREGATLVADRISDALMPLGAVAYSKQTLVLEVQRRIQSLQDAAVASGEAGLPDLGDASRAASALATGLSLASTARIEITIMPTATLPNVNDYGRGIFGSDSTTFRQHRDSVEEWLRTVRVPVVRDYVDLTAIGWIIIVVAIIGPWILIAALTGLLPVFFLPGIYELSTVLIPLGFWGVLASFFVWPVQVWGGFLLIHRSRIRRFAADRAAALDALGRGNKVPEQVKQFFGGPFPERAYGTSVYIFGIVLIVFALVGGLLLVSLGQSTVGEPFFSESWQTPLGIVLMLLVVPILLRVLRWQRHMTGELTRAGAEWQLLSGEHVDARV